MLPTTTVTLRDPAKLREAMDASKLSIRVLAARSHISPTRIAQLTRGEFQAINASSAVTIADALGLDVATLFHFPDGEALIRLGLIRAV